MRGCLLVLFLLAGASSALAEKATDLKGTWACEPAPMLIRGQWTELTYRIEIDERRDHLFKGTVHWSMPESKGVRGENTSGDRVFEGNWTALGVIGWDRSVELVSLGDLERSIGVLDGPDRIRFVG